MHLSTSDTHIEWFSYIFLLCTFVTLKDISVYAFPNFDQMVSCLHLTISLLCLCSYTPLWCNKIGSVGNLLSFRALYDIF